MAGTGSAGVAVAGGMAGRLSPALAVMAARSAPVVPAAARLLPVPAGLEPLVPGGGLRRGATVVVGVGGAPGIVSLTLAVLGSMSAAGAWCGAVGLPDLGVLAAAEAGVSLERLALVPRPGDQWAFAAAALLESLDVVIVGPPGRVRAADARRLSARARERSALLMVLDRPGSRGGGWGEPADVRLEVTGSRWWGLGQGFGYIQGREVEVRVSGRGAAARARSGRLLLAGPGSARPEASGGRPAGGGAGRERREAAAGALSQAG